MDSRELKHQYYRAKYTYKHTKSQANHDALISKSKAYKAEILKLKRRANTDFINKIRNMKAKQPKEYWRLLNTKQTCQVQAGIQDLFDHFKSLSNNRDDNTQHVHEDADIDVNDTPRDYDTTDVNRPFPAGDIRKTTKKLKNSKAPGIDMIINEYIKSSIDLMLPIYVYLFNRIPDTVLLRGPRKLACRQDNSNLQGKGKYHRTRKL